MNHYLLATDNYCALILITLVTTIVAALLIMRKRNRKQAKPINMLQQALGNGQSTEWQSVEVQPGVYGSKQTPVDKQFVTNAYDDVNTLYEAFQRGMKVSWDGDCAGTCPPGNNATYKFTKYSEMHQQAKELGSALVGSLHIEKDGLSFVGIYSSNRPEWLITELACMQHSIAVVPLYATLGPDAVTYAINHTKMKAVVVDTTEKAQLLITQAEKLPYLRHIIVIDCNDNEAVNLEETSTIQVHSFAILQGYGRVEPRPMRLPKPSDVCMVCFTSGTTGRPKGAMITHANCIANISAASVFMELLIPYIKTEKQTYMSYLPLAHVFEHAVHWMIWTWGGRVGYIRGDIKGLMDDLQILKPTFMPLVPRLLNRVYDRMQSKLAQSGKFSRALFNIAYKAKLARLKQGHMDTNNIWDRLVFSKIHNLFGGKCKTMVIGSAVVLPEVMEFGKVCFGSIVIEGFGMTESTCVSTASLPHDVVGGHVGGPVPCCWLKLADVPDLGYYANESKGELCIKGPSVFKGYYRDEKQTKEAIDEEGWLHSGDIAERLPNGSFRIIDRKKHIFKLAQYIVPEKVESVYLRCPLVEQVFVDGDSSHAYAVAIVVPEEESLVKWYKDNVQTNGNKATLEQICQSKEARQHVMMEMQTIGSEHGLNSLELVKAVHLSSEGFTIENNLATPTFKSKRPMLRKHFAHVISDLYAGK